MFQIQHVVYGTQLNLRPDYLHVADGEYVLKVIIPISRAEEQEGKNVLRNSGGRGARAGVDVL